MATTSESKLASTSYTHWEPSGSIDAIVIGSGLGGLTAAAMLAREAGQRVLVLERHYVPGGYTHAFHRPGFEWDVGVHYIGEVGDPTSPLRAIFDDLSEGELQWAPMEDAYDRMISPQGTFEYVSDRQRLEQNLGEQFPRQRDKIARYLQAVDDCVGSSQGFFVEKCLPGPLAWLAGWLLRRKFLKWASRTTAEVLSSLELDPDLRGVLTGRWLDYGLPPGQSSFGIHAIVDRHYQRGGNYPVGGASRFAATLIPSIRRAGGEVVIRAPVRQILVERGRATGVVMEDGRELRARRVISNAGVHNTYLRLLPDSEQAQSLAARARVLAPSIPYMNLYLGLDADDRQLELPNGNLWVYPGPDHDNNLAAFLADSQAPFPLVYISFPSGKEPTFAERHPGHATMQALCPAAYDWFKPWEQLGSGRRGEQYEQLKEQFAERLRETVERQVPQVRGHIQHIELSTPLTNRHFVGYAVGEPYGLAHTPQRFLERRLLRPQSPIRGLYLTGQDVTTISVVCAMISGLACASAILGRNLMTKLAKQPK
ncbi:MAG: NAD(P)/FAD-dependent oxidoreductase [Planctomycetales bacterium]|nr:NAD(P)/FAD-dependent oxidoreductase [Planctomycetales bacterium]